MKIYLINLDKNLERRTFMERQLGALGIRYERFPAVYGRALTVDQRKEMFAPIRSLLTMRRRMSDGEIGCALSHLGVYRRMVDENIPAAMIFEDDVVIDGRFSSALARVESALDAEKPQVYLFSAYRQDGAENKPEEIRPVRALYCADGYVITLAAAKLLLKVNYPVNSVPDNFKRWRRYYGLKLYQVFPATVRQDNDSFGSDLSIPKKLPWLPRQLAWLVDNILLRWEMMKSGHRIWLVALGFVLLYGGIVVWAYPLFSPDVACRYAPMADEFARGNWELAFHPRFGVFYQCVSGLIACLGVRGDHACQLASVLLLGLSAVPIWHLVRKLFGETAAWWTVALVLLCDDFARYAADGLRDTGKCLAFALLGWGVVSQRSRWFACGLLVLATLVSYGYAVAAVAVLGWCIACLVQRRMTSLVLPALAFVLATLADAYMVHAYTGHWLPAPHFIKILGGWL